MTEVYLRGGMDIYVIDAIGWRFGDGVNPVTLGFRVADVREYIRSGDDCCGGCCAIYMDNLTIVSKSYI